MQLPIALFPNDHLLFSFGHVAVAAAGNPKSPVESVESPIGYAWLPLLKKDRLILDNDEQEFELKVVADLPAGYFQSENFGFGKGVKNIFYT
jgi:hypothetical protein